MELSTKKAVIFGVANKRSIAWGIAQKYSQNGAEVFLVCQSEKLAKRVRPLAEEINATLYIYDFALNEGIDDLLKEVGKVDILVHSVAFAPTHTIGLPLNEVSEVDFSQTLNLSVYSFIKMINLFKNNFNNGASILSLTYLGSERVMTGYDLMGVAKAALEASIRYLCVALGKDGHRVNIISAGPVKTFASAAFPHFNKVLEITEERTPLKSNISTDDIGELASFLASDRSKMITGSIHYVDSGAHIMGA